MLKTHTEGTVSDFKGTVIDIETIGEFTRSYNDSRRYAKIIPVIFGFITSNELSMYCAGDAASIEELKQKMSTIVPDLKKPFYAFNIDFERGVLFHSLSLPVQFEGELQLPRSATGSFESKRSAVQALRIENYDDPFNDNGRACMEAWLRGEIEEAMAHNRSCLLKERDILLKRGCREREQLRLTPWTS